MQDRKPLKMEVSVPTLELLKHERRIKQEDYKKLDKMKNVSSSLHSRTINHSFVHSVFLAEDKEGRAAQSGYVTRAFSGSRSVRA